MPINIRNFTNPKYQRTLFFLQNELERMMFFMNLSIQDELQLFAEELYRHLTPSLLEKLAYELGFVKRKRKFSGNELAAICILRSQRTASDSLFRLCSHLHIATGTLISPEGLIKHFDKKAVEFLKCIFSALWKSKLYKTSAISSAALMYFQRIGILDATIFQVRNI